MARRQTPLQRSLDLLEALLGPPTIELPSTALGLILWENVAYLVSDERRAQAFRLLERRIGLDAKRLRAAKAEALLEVSSLGGMHPAQRAKKLRDIADLVLEDFGGDLESVLELPPAAARRALKKFPGIGEPGAEKVLLFTGTEPVLALESNGLRALLRLGYGTQGQHYARSYRSAQRAAQEEIEPTCEARRRAYDLLRRHGKSLCRAKGPECGACPLEPFCPFAARS